MQTLDRIEMEVVCGNEIFVLHEEIPGWFQFVLKTKQVFPSIPQEWDLQIMIPAFAANFTTLYDKESKPGARLQG